jgi:folate-binding protein YgfZ
LTDLLSLLNNLLMSTHASTSPLHDLHEQTDAEFQAYADLQIVSTFGEPQAEYAAIRKGVGLMDEPHRGVLEVTGKDRLPFLNNLVSNQTYDKAAKTGMAAGSGVYAFLLSAKSGRIITDMNVLERGERTFLEMDARMVPVVRDALEKYRFAEQVKFAGDANAWHQIALHGPKAAALLEELSAKPLPALPLLASAEITLFDVPMIIWRDDPTAASGYHLLMPKESAPTVWQRLMSLFTAADAGSEVPRRAGSDVGMPGSAEYFRTGVEPVPTPRRKLRPIGWAAFNAARIEAGRALFGIDFDDTILPAEAGQMARAVSFTKGCYPGQEIVARMHARKAVARQLIGLKFADDALPIAGAPVTDDQGNAIGGITSSTISPMLSNIAIAIAFLKRPFFSPGTVVNVPAEGAIRKAIVTEVPFLKDAND